MKKVNLGVLAVATMLLAVSTWIVVDSACQLLALGEMNQNLMGRRYNTPDEY